MRTLTSLLFIGCLVFVSHNVFSATLVVCHSCQITKIVTAIEKAKDGDTVLVKSGIYREGNLLIDKSITFIGEGAPVLDGEGKGEIVTIVADKVVMVGFVVQHVGTSYIKDQAGIRVKKANHCRISNNQLYDTFFGIYLEHTNNTVVENNLIIGEAVQEMSSGNAVHVWYGKNALITNNEIRKHRDGIYLEFVDNSRVEYNLSEGNLRYGLHFMFSNDDAYTNNIFRNNGAGVAVMFSRRISMYENRFEYNWGQAAYGLLLKEILDAEIHHNVFRENTIGIYVEGSNRIKYTHNELIGNGWALKVSGGCLDNVLENNNFIRNSFDVSLNSAVNNNQIDGNYWSSYSGYDLDRDGVGDVPYFPVKLFSYVVNKTPEAMVLLRSFFVDIINFSEKVSPVFAPAKLADNAPAMFPIKIRLK